MLLEHERDYDFGMDALVTVCSWNTNGIMILAWCECSPSLRPEPPHGSTTLRRRFRGEGAAEFAA